MFLEFYGLQEQPFGVTPDPRFISPSRTHSKAFNTLARGLEAGCGFLTLIAPPGTGKTTLVFQLLKEVNQTSNAIYLFHTQCNSRELLRYLLGGLGMETAGLDFVSMHEKLNQLLSREALNGRRLVLVIDESHNLDDSVLETVRLLSDYETHEMKLMQIVLVGQPPLAEKLSSAGLMQLKQRITVVCRLEPLTRAESFRYIEHRLRVAGHMGAPLFTPVALDMIVASAGGVPRNINKLCFNALMAGYAAGRKLIDSTILNEVLADLAMDSLLPMGALAEQNLALIPPSPTVTTQFAASGGPTDRIHADTGRSNPAEAMRNVREVTPLLMAQPETSPTQAAGPGRKALEARPGVAVRAFSRSEFAADAATKGAPGSGAGPSAPSQVTTQAQASSREASSQSGSGSVDTQKQRRMASTLKRDPLTDGGEVSSSRRLSQPAKLISGTIDGARVSNHSSFSRARARRMTKGAWALAAVLLSGVLLLAYRQGAIRLWPDQLRKAMSPVITSLRSVWASAKSGNPSLLNADSLGMDAVTAQSKTEDFVKDPGQDSHDAVTNESSSRASDSREGSANAEFTLGAQYALGKGVAQDEKQAFRLFKEAAERGNVSAQSALATSYWLGRGVGKDNVAAYSWAAVAHERGDALSGELLNVLVRTMSPDELSEATRKAEDWRHKHAAE